MNIGLVLSGGMGKGAYQVGALRALNEFVPLSEIKSISCASIGALNGYAYMTENLDAAEDLWMSLCEKDKRLFITQILRNNMLAPKIDKLYIPGRELPASFYCVLLDWEHRDLVYKDITVSDNSNIPLYLKASVSFPVYCHSVHIENTNYYDGAVVDNIPVFPLMNTDLDYIICMYFDDISYQFESCEFDKKIIKLTYPSDIAVKQHIILRRNSIADMIQNGYDRTVELLKIFFAKGYDNLDYIYDTIERRSHNGPETDLRITGDVIATKVNQTVLRLTKNKVLR